MQGCQTGIDSAQPRLLKSGVMNEPDDFALIPKPPSALEKTKPGAKRILAVMVAETLGLAQAQRPSAPPDIAAAQVEGWYLTGKKCSHEHGVPKSRTESAK